MPPLISSPRVTTRSQRVEESNSTIQAQAVNEKRSPAHQVVVETDEESSEVFKSDLDSIRSSVTCTICDQLLYEPWILACGHTYCYSCLCSWFIPNKRKKTCPDCRSRVKDLPAPNYLVKQIVETFVLRDELMPADESREQHQKKRKEENYRVEADKSSEKGLFKGCFIHQAQGTLVFNEEDRVYRCSRCSHEYNGGLICDVCELEFDPEDLGVIPGDFDERSLDSIEMYNMEHDIDGIDSEVDYTDEEDVDAFAPPEIILQDTHGLYRPSPLSHVMPPYDHGNWETGEPSDLDEDEDDEDDGEGSLRDFIDNNGDPHHHHLEFHGPINVSSDSDEDSSEESDEGGAISNGRRRARAVWIAARTATRNAASRHLGIGNSTPTADTSGIGDGETEDENEATYLQGGGWSPLDNGAESRYGEQEPIIRQHIRFASSDQFSTEERNDSDTIGQNKSDEYDDDDDDGDDDDDDDDDDDGDDNDDDDDDKNGRQDGSITPPWRDSPAQAGLPSRYESFECNSSNGMSQHVYSRPNYEPRQADTSTRESTIDREGDVEMSVSPPSSAISRGNSTTREGSVEYLGTANTIHDLNDDSSDDSIVPATRRRPRRNSRNSLTPDYDPRISMMFAQHQSDLRDVTQRESPYFEDPQNQIEHDRPTSMAATDTEDSDIRRRANSRNRLLPTRRAAISQQHAQRQSIPSIMDRMGGPVIMPSSSTRPNRIQRQYHRR